MKKYNLQKKKYIQPTGARHHSSKLKPEIINLVSEDLACGKSYTEIALSRGLNYRTIKKIEFILTGKKPIMKTEKLELLKTLWTEGKSADEIAQTIGVKKTSLAVMLSRERKKNPEAFPLRRKPKDVESEAASSQA
jgi:hypothetical protein